MTWATTILRQRMIARFAARKQASPLGPVDTETYMTWLDLPVQMSTMRAHIRKTTRPQRHQPARVESLDTSDKAALFENRAAWHRLYAYWPKHLVSA